MASSPPLERFACIWDAITMQTPLRVYHFTNKKYGLEDIEKRRLKIARIDDLNDPYELLAPQWSDGPSRDIWLEYRMSVHNLMGVICFNGDWNNIVHWSHYADKHRGVCLVFDVFANSCFEVNYKSERLDISLPALVPNDSQTMMDLLFPLMATKYVDWNYEKERRLMALLHNVTKDGEQYITKDGEHYFQSFRDLMLLKEVTIGVRCDLLADELRNKLGDIASDVQIYKARLSAKNYAIEREMQ